MFKCCLEKTFVLEQARRFKLILRQFFHALKICICYTVNSKTEDPYNSETIGDMESITDRKIIKN